ncbi:MAG: toxin-antitoxin system protein [Candidatus Promineofilum sp.]|nr:toxin-antitoxin system protein [Promineifilum sp.]
MEASLTTTIRVSRRTRDRLQRLAEQYGSSMQAVLEEAVELYQGQRLLEATNAAYAALRANPVAWQELQEERAEWDTTLNDGLEGLG